MSKRLIKKAVKKLAPKLAENYANVVSDVAAINQKTDKIINSVDILADRISPETTKFIKLQELYSKSDPYQPTYGVSGVGNPQRDSRDRCESLLSYFNNDVKGVRFLDVGCYFGFISFYLADRGATVDGWDNNELNIEIANATKDINGIDASFFVKEFNPEAIGNIPKGKYDVVIIYSVLHWLIALYGLEYVQECMRLLLEKVPVVIVELAQKGEDKKLFWDKAVPKRDLDIFNSVDGAEINKIGEFDTHLSTKRRPVYVVQKNHVSVNGNNYPIQEILTKAYPGAENWRGLSSTYYMGDKFFAKEYKFIESDQENRRYVVNEINFYLQNSSQHNHTPIKNVPELIDYELTHDKATIVLKNTKGVMLSQACELLSIKEKEKVVEELLLTLIEFEVNGLYHNDIRSWNVIVNSEKEPTLIDMELVSNRQYENNLIAFCWLVSALLQNKTESKDRNKVNLPDEKIFAASEYFKKLHSAINADTNKKFAALHNELNGTKSAAKRSK